MTGKERRLSRIVERDGKTVIVPIDDSLIFGPFAGLHKIADKINQIISANPNAILAHSGVFKNDICNNEIGRIINLSASTTNNKHTQKHIISNIENMIRYDAYCIAVHVNLSSKYEGDMLFDLGKTISEAEKYSIPVMAIIYPRTENKEGEDYNYLDVKDSNNKKYTDLLCHCVRVAKDMGVDIIKTHYAGNPQAFTKVVEAAYPIPVVVAGGEIQDAKEMLNITENAIKCGGKGISFGRNIFSRKDSTSIIKAITAIVHDGYSAEEAYTKFNPSNELEE